MTRRINVAIQASYFEKEHNDCLSCGENIKHPICPECIANGFHQWTHKFSELHGIDKKIRNFLKAHDHLNGDSTKCVACNRKTVHICPHCFTDFLYNTIKKAGAGTRALTEFLFIFNFDFEHAGYSEELEAMGGY
jgi:hypothetical protein